MTDFSGSILGSEQTKQNQAICWYYAEYVKVLAIRLSFRNADFVIRSSFQSAKCSILELMFLRF